MTAPLLSLEGVRKIYRRGVVDRTPTFQLTVDHSFDKPEIVGVMGPNGAGKTTLFEMIAGSSVPTQGKVWVAGQDIQTVRYRQRDRLGALLEGRFHGSSALAPQRLRMYSSL